MTTTYVCRHCGRPAVKGEYIDAHDDDGRGYRGGHRCNPADPDSPTCEAIEAKRHYWIRDGVNDVDCIACGLHLNTGVDPFGVDTATCDTLAEPAYCLERSVKLADQPG